MKSDVDSSGRIVLRLTRGEAEKLHDILRMSCPHYDCFAGSRHVNLSLRGHLKERIYDLHQWALSLSRARTKR